MELIGNMSRLFIPKNCKDCNIEKKDSQSWYGEQCRKCYRRTDKGKLISKNSYEKDKFKLKDRLRKAKNRTKHEFTLDLECYSKLIILGCFYCKDSLIEKTGISLDRIDNTTGYTPINVLPCCGICNKIRNEFLTVAETVQAIDAIIKYRGFNL